MSAPIRDHPWGAPDVSYQGEPIVPDFETNGEFMRWCRKLSPDQKALAKLRCVEDRAYFIHNFCWFRAKPLSEGMARVMPVGWIQFRLWPAQLRVLREIAPWSRIFSIKCRQIGLTWLFACLGLHQTIFFPDQLGFVFSYDQTLANKLLKRIEDVWKRLPDFLLEETAEKSEPWSADVKTWSNRSAIEAFPATEAANIGEAYTWGIFDEFCVVEHKRKMDVGDMVTSAMINALRSHQGWFAANSTARYRAGWAWSMAKKLFPEIGGRRKEPPGDWGDWIGVFIPMTDHPYFQGEDGQRRIAKELETTEPRIFWRENPRNIEEAFAIGGDSVFDVEHLNRHLHAITSGEAPPARYVTFSNKRGKPAPLDGDKGEVECRLYVERIPGHSYILALDPTRQKASKDWCGGIVLDVTTGEVVCEIHWKFSDAIEFADFAMMVAYYYNEALLVPEVNVDRGLVRRIVEKAYPNPYRRERSGDSAAPIDTPMEDQIGFLLNPGSGSGSRSKVLARAKYEVRSTWVRIYSEELISEMSTFVVHISPDGRREKEEAASGAHDDLLMPFAIACYVAREQPEYIQEEMDERVGGYTVQEVLCDGRPEVGGWESGEPDVVWGEESPAFEAAETWDDMVDRFRNA